MALTFECGRDVIEKVIGVLKKRGYISEDANFNYNGSSFNRKLEILYS